MKSFISTLLILLLALAGFAQNYSLSQFLAQVKQNNLQLKQSLNQVSLAQQDKSIALSGLLPSAHISANYQRDFNRNFVYISETENDPLLPNKFPSNFRHNISATGLIEQSLLDPIAISNLKISKLNQEYAQLQHGELANQLIQEASQLFIQALYLKESVAVLKENSALAKAQLQQVKELFEGGAASEFRLQQATIFYMQSLSTYQTSLAKFSNLKTDLQAIANIPKTDTFAISGNLLNLENSFNNPNNLDSVLEHNQEIQLSKQKILISQQAIKTQKAGWSPQLKLGVGYNFNAVDDKFEFDRTNKLGYGQVSLVIPIIEGGRKQAQLAKAKLEAESAQISLQQKQLQLATQYKNAHVDLDAAVQKIDYESEIIELSKKELDITKEKIKLGLITNLEMKEIRQNYTRAKLNLLNAYLDYQSALIRIKKITGNI